MEDVGVVGSACYPAPSYPLVPRGLQVLREAGTESMPVIVGGAIPPKVLKLGIATYFAPGSSPQAISDFVASVKGRSAVREL